MKEVSKEEFKEIYFRLGGGNASGWDLDYWNKFFEENEEPDMKYLVQKPQTREETRMMIVTDCGMKEYRMFFLTENAEENFFEFPGKD